MYFDFTKSDDVIKIIKMADISEFPEMADEIRAFLLEKVSRTGGHLASNLGIVELTMAIHRVYNSPVDKIIFDVGHQSYVHKIITGRSGEFDNLRQYKGLSGFPKSKESVHDAYDTGHSSTSLSAAEGMAVARDLKGEDYQVVALIGDGSMTGGLAFEALNNIGSNGTNVKIVLNDNGVSIEKNVGAISSILQNIRNTKKYMDVKSSIKENISNIPIIGEPLTKGLSHTKDVVKHSVLDEQGIFFEDLGLKYIGPIDGYNFETMIEAFELANSVNGPTIVHVITKKGKGYEYAEEKPEKFHGIAPFNQSDGNVLSESKAPSFSSLFGLKLQNLARENEKIVAITAAMGVSTGLGPFSKEFPERYFDVGIAEQHAVIFAAGLAKNGMIPVCAIYSTFLQRAFDQIISDVALQNLHVVFAVDRAGLVGADGETHHGQFDLSYLNLIPNIKVLTPSGGTQLCEMLDYAINECDGPVAIRYPRGSSGVEHLRIKPFSNANIVLSEGKDVTILAVGAMLDTGIKTAEILREQGFDVGVCDITIAKPLNEDEFFNLDTRLVVIIEDNVRTGGFGEHFAAVNNQASFDVLTFALPDDFVEQGSVEELRRELGLTPVDISKGVLEYLEGKA